MSTFTGNAWAIVAHRLATKCPALVPQHLHQALLRSCPSKSDCNQDEGSKLDVLQLQRAAISSDRPSEPMVATAIPRRFIHSRSVSVSRAFGLRCC